VHDGGKWKVPPPLRPSCGGTGRFRLSHPLPNVPSALNVSKDPNQTFQPTHVAPCRVLTRRGQIVQVAFTVIGDGSLGAGGNTSKRRLTEMSRWLLKEVVVLVTPWVKTSRGYEHGAREEHEEGVSPEPKIRGKTERKMERMGHDTSQPATSAVRGTKPRAE
jgi:hypothetical protein